MKKFLWVALGLLAMASCKKADDLKPIDPFVEQNYSEDAKVLLARLLKSGAVTTDRNKAEFNKQELNKIQRALEAVYLLHTPQTDTIFNVAKVHTFPYFSLRYVSLQVDKSDANGQKIIAHQPTSNAGFESLMARYGFTYYGNSVVYTDKAFVAMRSAEAYNLPPILAELQKFSFVITAEQSGTLGDGNDIEYKLSGNGAELDFAVKSGDCPAGCIVRHGWKYRVDGNYKATYLGRY